MQNISYEKYIKIFSILNMTVIHQIQSIQTPKYYLQEFKALDCYLVCQVFVFLYVCLFCLEKKQRSLECEEMTHSYFSVMSFILLFYTLVNLFHSCDDHCFNSLAHSPLFCFNDFILRLDVVYFLDFCFSLDSQFANSLIFHSVFCLLLYDEVSRLLRIFSNFLLSIAI